MKFTVLTLFPEAFKSYLNESIIARAINQNQVLIEIVDFRNFSENKLKQVDDYQYGGGGGMVIALPAIVKAIRHYKTPHSKVYLLSPQGTVYNQSIAVELVKSNEHIILICGHYEGFDERIINYVDGLISIGDYIITGGELGAMVVLDSCIRLIEGVITSQSLTTESFSNDLLDYPVYTKPLNFEGHKVPDVLLSGNHQKIDEFRKTEQVSKTKKYRPDLYKRYLNKIQGEKKYGKK